ncbi:ROK family protein [Streptomyces sp. CWNU-1]|uniref:ROK family protein n=1 Tax=Streptomyces albipurpureus TaxID=2897419 RepID=A0ABT0UGW8_9ACTN|nr:ROK family protein [Streptomyces sp. CWNU-1]
MRAVRERPGSSQTQLIEATGLAAGAVSALVNALVGAGVLAEEFERTGRGRPRRNLRLDDRFADLVGIQITRSGMRARATTLAGRVLADTRRLPTAPWTVGQAAPGLAEVAAEVTAGLRRPKASPTVVVSFPGVVETGGLSSSELDWLNEPRSTFLADLRAAGFPRATIRNDGELATLAEWRGGAAQGDDNAVVILLGRGLGGSAVVDGRLLRGHGSPLGFGHVPIDPDGPLCACGQHGCLEVFASLQSFATQLDDGSQLAAKPSADYAAELERRAAAGDDGVLTVLTSAQQRLHQFGRLVAALFSPEVVILSGQAAILAPYLLDGPVGTARVPFVRGGLDADAPLTGAVLAAQEDWIADPLAPVRQEDI